MARDNSPEERQKKQLERKSGWRKRYDRILIVSEGSKTEPNYFRGIVQAEGLNTANVAVHPNNGGTTPKQVVQHAEALFEKGRAFERVYAVFDRDDHPSYHEALTLAESLNGKRKNDDKQPVVFRAIVSVPSFELWLLLHFEDVHEPLSRNRVMDRLKKHIPDYDKSANNIFARTCEHLPKATERAKQLAKRVDARNDSGPFTAIDELVTLLTGLKNRPGG